MTIQEDKASFAFQSFDFTKEVFSSGVTTLSFSHVEKGVYTQYGIRIRDDAGRIFTGRGLRIEKTSIAEQLRDPDKCTSAVMATAAGELARFGLTTS